MGKSKLLNDFFNQTFESAINEKMMYYSYEFEYDLVLKNIYELLEIDLSEFLNYIISNYNVHYLTSEDVVQFSDFDDCTENICSLYKLNGDTGFKFVETGRMLLDDGIERNDGAYRKYGENHSKTACNLGLLQVNEHTYYLSCLGYIFNTLESEVKNNLVCRLILRNKLIKRLLYKVIRDGQAIYNNEVIFLKESTINRRKSNVKKLLKFIVDNNDCFSEIIQKIII